MFKLSDYRTYVSVAVRSASPALCLVLLLLAPKAWSQTTGSLSGNVHDASGALVAGAKVTLTAEKSGAKRSTVSNGEGYFTINAVQPDTYDLQVNAKGFGAYTIQGIDINPGDAKTVASIKLKVGELSQEVTVTASAAGVNLNSGEKGYVITADDIKRLSTVGRDVTELIKTLPGFAISTGGGLSNNSTNNGAQTVGFGSTSTSSFSANGATPQTGATQVISDGASTMDPGDMGASIANVNMDMVEEVKVQTAAFGADSAKGPVVINAVGKSGGSSYHGTGYVFARNGVLNANDWLSNYNRVDRPSSEYFFPGGNVGGPVRIPGTGFNRNKKMTFFTGYEYYKQTKFDQLLLSFIPTARMLSGDLTPASIGAALNVGPDVVTTQCPNFYSSGTLSNSGGYCYSPGLSNGITYTIQDQQITPQGVQTSPTVSNGLIPVDPRALIYAKFWPKINRVPQAANGLASDGYNYVNALTSTHNGYQYRARIDENFTDNTKLYVTYNFEKINDETPIDNTYYAGSDIIPYPTSAFSNTKSNSVSTNFTHVFSPSLTNEVVVTGTYYYQPNQLANRSLVQDGQTGWKGGRIFNNGALQLPGLVDYEEGVPDFAMGYFPENSSYLRKYSYNAADNLSKQWKTHLIKLGVYFENTGNNQVPFIYSQGLNTFNHYNSGCYTLPDPVTGKVSGHVSQLFNNVANFLQGCSGFSQSSSSTPADLHFSTVDFFVNDEWKVNQRLTLTLGIRFDHLGPWTDPHGIGLAVWNPPAQHTPFPVTSNPKSFPGISWHGTDSTIPLSGQASTTLFYSPRFGIAYDLYGNGKSVFRGGFGYYRFHDSYNDSAGALNTSIGIQSYSTPQNLSCTYDQLTNSSNLGSGKPAIGVDCFSAAANSTPPFTIYALDAKDTQQPLTYNYNFTVDQAMPGHSNLELSYVGNQSTNIFTEGNLSNQNYIPLGALFQPDPITGAVTVAGSTSQNQQDYRPYPNYNAVYVPHHIGYGNYNALQVSLNKQKGAFIYGLNYTWAKALGIRGDYRTGGVGDPSNLRNNYGYLAFNRNHAFNATYSYQVGEAYKGNRLLRAVLNQWEVSGITTVQSGPDVAVLNGTTNTSFGLSGGAMYTPPGATSPVSLTLNNVSVLGTPDINLQPVVTCDPKSGFQNVAKYGKQYINAQCFSLPALGRNGNFELPDIHGPAYFDTDLTLQRSVKLDSRQNLQFRIAAFNFLNHPLAQFYGGSGAPTALTLNFGSPNATATSAAAAIAAATLSTSSANFGYTPYKSGYRIVELSARYNF